MIFLRWGWNHQLAERCFLRWYPRCLLLEPNLGDRFTVTTQRSLNSPMLSMMPRPANSDGQLARVAWNFDLFKARGISHTTCIIDGFSWRQNLRILWYFVGIPVLQKWQPSKKMGLQAIDFFLYYIYSLYSICTYMYILEKVPFLSCFCSQFHFLVLPGRWPNPSTQQ